MAKAVKQKAFRDFEKAFAKVKKANAQQRVDAVGTLTPKLLREHLESGQDLVLAYGRKGHTITYTIQDLLSFKKHIERKQSRNKIDIKGVPLLKLENTSWQEDKKRMRQQIKNATLYKFYNNILSFQVTASGESKAAYHQVKIRLEEWYDNLVTPISWLVAARNVAVGRMSFDCTCGRHQYWFRYLATIGGFALKPFEKDFPKIRNPRLGGCCCKHVLKVLQQLKSPSVHNIIAKELERQAESAGYVDKVGAKFLSPKDLEKAKRARGSKKENEAAKKAFEQFKKAGKAFSQKMDEERTKAELAKARQQAKTAEARSKALEAKAAKEQQRKSRDKIILSLQAYIEAAKEFGGASRDQAIESYAKKYKLKPIEVIAIADEEGLE